ncbi:hypothetical protein HGRIS_001427 [Hohenbuehelia grisea]|uniref:Fungal-type protein kinase domain-containing protein n=1 Tax=Hohenbuehelia grisea TaxID=104357 RepID=A0ABR3JQC3_9AGAR
MLPAAQRPGRIEFRDQRSKRLDHHPRYKDANVLPDIIAILVETAKKFDQLDDSASLSWHHLLSLIEEKSRADKKNGPAQCGTYLGYACQARPDIPAMYGVSFAPSGYIILYNDATGVENSKEFTLDDLKPLAYYIYALYSPPDRHDTRDTSITLSSRLFDPPCWTIDFNGVIYRDCHVTFVGAPHKRQTWIAVCDEPLAVIKDSWWDDGRNWDEGELFGLLHEKGPVPGWVQIRSTGRIPILRKDGPGYLETFSNTMGCFRKFKKRIVMSTYGQNLSRCGSVLEFLKAMYDVLEAHRFAALHRNILHRDISQDNILIHPIHPKGDDVPHMVGPRPKFIHEIMEGTEHAAPVAVLCDLDNGCELERAVARSPTFMSRHRSGRPDEDHRNPQRTGTPMYIARALCDVRFLKNVDYEPMPPIPEAIRVRYSAAHACDPPQLIRSLEDTDDTIHGSKHSTEVFRNIKGEQEKPFDERSSHYHTLFYHRARYDAESVYWVIVTFLVRARPSPRKLTTDPDRGILAENEQEQLLIQEDHAVDNVEPLQNLWKAFAQHRILETTEALAHYEKDFRATVFDQGPQAWKSVLHAELANLAPMLRELSVQVEPEYIYLQPDLDTNYKDHLHEAMQRILLKYILPMWDTDGIPLFKSIQRRVLILVRSQEWRPDDGWERTAKGQSHPGTRASKRNEDSHGEGSRASKRSRGNDGSTDDKGKSRENAGGGSRASQKSGKGSGSRGSKRGSGAGAGTSTIVTRSKSKK